MVNSLQKFKEKFLNEDMLKSEKKLCYKIAFLARSERKVYKFIPFEPGLEDFPSISMLGQFGGKDNVVIEVTKDKNLQLLTVFDEQEPIISSYVDIDKSVKEDKIVWENFHDGCASLFTKHLEMHDLI